MTVAELRGQSEVRRFKPLKCLSLNHASKAKAGFLLILLFLFYFFGVEGVKDVPLSETSVRPPSLLSGNITYIGLIRAEECERE